MLHAWGDADEMVPPPPTNSLPSAQYRNAPYCALRLAGANHGLQAVKWMACSRCGLCLGGLGPNTPARAVRQRDLSLT